MEKKKISIMVAASKAVEYKKKNPSAEIDEIMHSIMKDNEIIDSAKTSAVPAVARAIKYKESTNLTDKQVLQRIMNEMPDIIASAKH